MAITPTLVESGYLHMKVTGDIVLGNNVGEIGALGVNQLLIVSLAALDRKVYEVNRDGFEDQFYVLAMANDQNCTGIRLDATQFEYTAAGVPRLRLRVDVSAVPANITLWLEAHHSWGR